MLECVLDYALYTSLRFLFEKSKKKSSKSKRYSWWFGHNPNSTKFQLANCFWFLWLRKTFEPIFFTSYNEFCSRQRRAKRSRAGRALDGVPTVANRNGLALAEDCTRSKVLLVVFQLFFQFFIFLFFAVNTMSLLGIQTTICVFLSIWNRVCVCFVFFSCKRTTNWREMLLRLFVSFCFVLWVCKARLGPN